MKSTYIQLTQLLIYTISPLFLKAQDDSSDTIKQLNEVVISVNKVEESKRKVAHQIEVLDAKQISSAQAQTTADLLQSTGKISVQKSQQGGGSPVIRGFEASRVLIVVDGIRMNNIIYRSGHLQNIITLDNAILDRAEVLFGPATTIYGSDALGGAICFFTKKPMLAAAGEKNNLKVNAFYRYGDVNNESTGHVDFNIGTGKIASLTSFTFSQFGDLRSGANQNPFYDKTYGERFYYVKRFNNTDSLVKNTSRYNQIQSGYSQYDILQKVLFQPSEKLSHQLNIQYSNSTDIPRYDRLTDPSNTGLRFSEWYYGPQERLLTAYDFNKNDESSFFQRIHFGLNYQAIEESRVSRRFNSIYHDSRIENVGVVGGAFDVQHKSQKHVVRLGIDFQYNDLKSTANRKDIVADTTAKLDTRYPDGKNTLLTSGVYLSHTYQINENLLLTDGIRVGFSSLKSTFVDTTFFQFPFSDANQQQPLYSGSLGLINTPSDDLKLSVLFSTGFRTPNVDDLAKVFETVKGTVIVPNSDLKPEKTINTEIGITKWFESKARWESSIYYTQFIDAIVNDKFSYQGNDSILYQGVLSKVTANQNKGKAYIYGFATTLNNQFSEHFTTDFSMNYTYGRVKTDSADVPLDHIPPFMAHLGLTYSLEKFSAKFFVNYNGWKKAKNYSTSGEDNAQYAPAEGMPAWFTANLRVSYKVHKYITIQSGIDNIFDTQYRTFSSGINAPGRNIFGVIRFTL
ncbi:MAG TPA: TonB-dependent receptor [Bacteroidia bacterium]|nr:TonB-dependent receptor [Bacteroidia bacterium]HRH07798.1 TonB-dependent receptor [Bacteroidia bacterium]